MKEDHEYDLYCTRCGVGIWRGQKFGDKCIWDCGFWPRYKCTGTIGGHKNERPAWERRKQRLESEAPVC
jgi:hypothetical protein